MYRTVPYRVTERTRYEHVKYSFRFVSETTKTLANGSLAKRPVTVLGTSQILYLTTASLSGGGCQGCPGISTFGKGSP